jgi:hypothetical protein
MSLEIFKLFDYSYSVTTDERLDRLTGIVDALASTVVAHDTQIEGLIAVAEKQAAALEKQALASANLEKRWEAYLNTLPRH